MGAGTTRLPSLLNRARLPLDSATHPRTVVMSRRGLRPSAQSLDSIPSESPASPCVAAGRGGGILWLF